VPGFFLQFRKGAAEHLELQAKKTVLLIKRRTDLEPEAQFLP
jgi:hypothetical protein